VGYFYFLTRIDDRYALCFNAGITINEKTERLVVISFDHLQFLPTVSREGDVVKPRCCCGIARLRWWVVEWRGQFGSFRPDPVGDILATFLAFAFGKYRPPILPDHNSTSRYQQLYEPSKRFRNIDHCNKVRNRNHINTTFSNRKRDGG